MMFILRFILKNMKLNLEDVYKRQTQYDTESLAKFAFSIFWQAMCFAQKQQVPILLDY